MKRAILAGNVLAYLLLAGAAHGSGSDYLLSFYCGGRCCTGRWSARGLTSSGVRPAPGWTIACPRTMRMGQLLEIEGLGLRQCQDRGRAIVGWRIDVYVSSHVEAVRYGVRRAAVRPLVLP